MFYKNKKILVTGGTGLIGRPLVEMLVAKTVQKNGMQGLGIWRLLTSFRATARQS